MFDTKFFPGAKKFWHMGTMYDWNTANIHVMSHALHYGSSVFEGIRAYDTVNGPAVFRLKEHIDRFFISAHAFNMKVPYNHDAIINAIKRVMKENRLRAAYIRPNLFYSYGNLGLVPKASPVELTIGCWAWGAYLGEESLEKGVRTLIIPTRRIHPTQMDMRAKIGGMYAQSNIAGSYARSQGFDEAVFLNLEGRVAEGPGENIIVVKNTKLKTNDETESVLPGITRQTVMELARDMGYEVSIGPITLDEFLDADELFFTGTAAEVTPICCVTDGREKDEEPSRWKEFKIGQGKPGEITRRLSTKYAEVVRGKDRRYEHWLSYVYDSPEEVKRYLEPVELNGMSKF
jgi:branched-chain amino acid aminotransferase